MSSESVTQPQNWNLGKQDKIKLAGKRSKTTQSLGATVRIAVFIPRVLRVVNYKHVSVASSASSPLPAPNITEFYQIKLHFPGSLSGST